MARSFDIAKECKKLPENAFSILKSKIVHLNEVSVHLEKKSQCYDESIKRKVDLFNVQSGDYKDYRKEIKDKKCD